MSDTKYFESALAIVNFALEDRINHAARTSLASDIICVATGMKSASLIEQLYLTPNDIERIQSIFHHSKRFNHLDLLSIGDDHIYIIFRTLLLQDINEYLSESDHGIRRVFINVDYMLLQPTMLPGRKYEPLDNYLKNTLLPDLYMRIQCWDQAELCYLPLLTPDRYDIDKSYDDNNNIYDKNTNNTRTTQGEQNSQSKKTKSMEADDAIGELSMVTLSEWILGYPIIYVVPTVARMMARKQAERAAKGLQKTVDDEMEDSSHNNLANKLIVKTKIMLQRNEAICGLKEHCLLSFTYPAALMGQSDTETEVSSACLLPNAPKRFSLSDCSSTEPILNHFGTASVQNPPRNEEASFASVMPGALPNTSSPMITPLESIYLATQSSLPQPKPSAPSITQFSQSGNSTSPPIRSSPFRRLVSRHLFDIAPDNGHEEFSSSTQQHSFRPNYLQDDKQNRQQNNSDSRKYDKKETQEEDHSLLPPSRQEICAAGQAMMKVLHTRFWQQDVWMNWQIGQDTFTLPVVPL
ncbi:hypothetical protein FBU30_004060 [Linnemannia zychae]|nr:hypothetical protein FBU30_004060 [Linnemannia zychae]